MEPIYKLDDEGNATSEKIKYSVKINDGEKQYGVWINDKYVHFTVNGNRYRLNLQTNSVDRLVVKDINANTVDFSTSFNPTQLRDSLSKNVRNTMLNKIVQSVLDSALSDYGSIDIALERPIGLYLDMLPDETSLDHFVAANRLDADSDECVKFSQIYKNNLKEIDESNIANGNLYKYLTGKIDDAFGANTSILVVDSPSIEVKRVDGVDTFTYVVYMDVHIRQNKNWMRENGEDGNFVIANAKIEDVKCMVKFTPIYDNRTYRDNMTYDVSYSVDTAPEYSVKYNQIIYKRDGKVKYMTTPEERTISGVVLSRIAGLNLKYEQTNLVLSNMSEELISKNIGNVFSPDDYEKMFKYINDRTLTDEVVDHSIQENFGYSDGIWPIDVKNPPNIENSVSVNRGQTYIRGQLYNVSEDDSKLIPTSGS